MRIFYRAILLLLCSAPFVHAQNSVPYKVNMHYKAYWGGFVVAEIASQTNINAARYQISANYRIKGLASILGKSQNNTMARGILATDGRFAPEFYESKGNFGKFKYHNQVTFDPETLKVTEHIQELELRKGTEYIPIADEDKYGIDPMTLFLNMIMNKNFNEDYIEEYKERQFGGLFVSEQSITCNENETLKEESRSVFKGETTVCKIDGELLAGGIKRTKPRKKNKPREDDDQDSRLWFGKMKGFDAMVPVYTEFQLVGVKSVFIYPVFQ